MENIGFEELYKAYAPMVYWTAYGIIHNHDTAQETTQVVFMKAFEGWGKLEHLKEPQMKAWLFKTARNAVIDRMRKEKRETIDEFLPERVESDERSYPETSYIKNEQAQEIWEIIEALPAIYREPIVLHYFADLSQKEAASLLRVSGGTYRSRLSRGRTLLEKCLKGGS
ncbi:RNA polymerase sigma factor [Christensenellaceae bacterium OttesenSCG-928-M15]|nr:RNA polymerase sigma factor [Christensenellaceae bacterium OttesenSCG-928-M15]